MIYIKSLRLSKTEAKHLNQMGFIVELNTACRQTQKHSLYDIYALNEVA